MARIREREGEKLEYISRGIPNQIADSNYSFTIKCCVFIGYGLETQTAVVWSCFPFIRSGQNHLARHSERERKTRQTDEEVGRQRQGMDRPGVRQVPEGSGEQGKMEKTGCKIICGAPTTLAIKRLMVMMMNE